MPRPRLGGGNRQALSGRRSRSKPAPNAVEFGGFEPGMLRFLEELSANNNRLWFDANRQRYEELALNPALDFIAAMASRLDRISRRFEAIPKRSGGSLMRAYRDTRFSADKTPYKTNLGIQFRHVVGRDIHAPGFYLHIEPGDCFVGVGSWHPHPEALAKIRARIVAKPEAWQQVLDDKSFRRHFVFAGDSLKRPPKGYAADHPLIEDLRRKDFIAVKALDENALTDKNLPAKVAALFAAGAPLMKFLCAAVEVDY